MCIGIVCSLVGPVVTINSASYAHAHSKTGILVCGPNHGLKLKRTIESLTVHSVDHKVFTAEEVMVMCACMHACGVWVW